VTDLLGNLTMGTHGPVTDADEQLAILASLSTPPIAIAQDPEDREALPGIIFGEQLAEQLKLFPGDRIHLINPIGGGTGPMGAPMPHVRPFRVAGIFYSGM
jgi:ABC-type lipoprotein release transport system permease subunit